MDKLSVENTEKAHKQIKRIPGHLTHKLNTYDLLFVAAEYDKYQISDLI